MDNTKATKEVVTVEEKMTVTVKKAPTPAVSGADVLAESNAPSKDVATKQVLHSNTSNVPERSTQQEGPRKEKAAPKKVAISTSANPTTAPTPAAPRAEQPSNIHAREPQSAPLGNVDGAQEEQGPRKYTIPKKSARDKELNTAGAPRRGEQLFEPRGERVPVTSFQDERRRQENPSRQNNRPGLAEIVGPAERERLHAVSRRDERSASPVRRIDRYDGRGNRNMDQYRGRDRSPRDDYLDYNRAERYDSRDDNNRRRPSEYFETGRSGSSSGGLLSYGNIDPRGQSAQYSRPPYGSSYGEYPSLGMGMGNYPYDRRVSGNDGGLRPVANMGFPDMQNAAASSMDKIAGSGFHPPPSSNLTRPGPSSYDDVHPKPFAPAPKPSSNIRPAGPQAPSGGVHRNWQANYMHTAKCDKCEQNCKDVQQRCVDCALQLCKKCIDKGQVARDSKHEEPVGGFNWTVPAGLEKPRKRVAKKVRYQVSSDAEIDENATMNTGSPKPSGRPKKGQSTNFSPFGKQVDLEDEDLDLQEALHASVQPAPQGSHYRPASVPRPATASSRRAARLPTEEELNLGNVETFRDAIEMLQKASDVPLDSVDSQQLDVDRAKAFRNDPTLRTIVEVENNPEKAKIFLQSAALIMRVVMAKQKVRDAE